MKRNNSKRKFTRDDKMSGKSSKFSKTRKRSTVESDEFDSGRRVSATNPADWYIPNDVILNNVASIPFGSPAGGRLDFGEYGNSINDSSFPGIMTITVQNFPGYNTDATSPFNMTIKNVYTFLRHRNSGAKTYDAVDYGCYYLAMDSLLSYLSWMRRIYGIMNLRNQVNRYVPYALTTANGVDYQDIMRNLALLRSYINQFALRISSLCIPASTSYVARHMWMYEGVYSDHVTGKAQLYLFKPAGFHKYTYDSNNMPMLQWVPFQATYSNRDDLLSYDEIVTYGENLLSSVLSGFGEEDFNIISADILKAYGESAVYSAVSMPDDYVIMPSYDESVLKQIQNAYLTMNRGEIAAIYRAHPDVFDIKQHYEPNGIGEYITSAVYKNLPTNGANADAIDRLISLPTSTPDPREVIDATRLSVQGTVLNSGGTPFIYYNAMGSELPLFANIYRFEDRAAGWNLYQGSDITFRESFKTVTSPVTFTNTVISNELRAALQDAAADQIDISTTAGRQTVSEWFLRGIGGSSIGFTARFNAYLNQYLTEQMDSINELSYMSNFDWHPFVWYDLYSQLLQTKSDGYVEAADTPVSIYAKTFMGDVDNFAIIKRNNLLNMHEAALLAEFGIKDFGTYSV